MTRTSMLLFGWQAGEGEEYCGSTSSRDPGTVLADRGCHDHTLRYTYEFAVTRRALRLRTVRDPIHGDIPLDPVAAAVVDTIDFQRLRYIRQNGLLHFVFPGAVHTRFAHSLGTLAVAQRVAEQLLQPLHRAAESEREKKFVRYIRAVFELAALLHDAGHSAFSHSIESVDVNGEPFLGRLGPRLRAWGEEKLLAEYMLAHQEDKDPPTDSTRLMHEQIGLVVVRKIFGQDEVKSACSLYLNEDPVDLANDVCAMMDGKLAASARYLDDDACLGEILSRAENDLMVADQEGPAAGVAGDLFSELHSLVSGTIDVDRMDYLNRDSLHCGVSYGRCDIEIIISAMQLGLVGGALEMGIKSKARHALDDLLWSRFQLFVQVLNHKTNVALNAVLDPALKDAVGDDRFDPPKDYPDLLDLTDDKVLAAVRSPVVRGKLTDTLYAKALVRRQVPLHVHTVRDDGKVDTAQEKQKLAARYGVTEGDVIVGPAESQLIKTTGALPWIFSRDRLSREWTKPERYKPFRTIAALDPEKPYREYHFFVDRSLLEDRNI